MLLPVEEGCVLADEAGCGLDLRHCAGAAFVRSGLRCVKAPDGTNRDLAAILDSWTESHRHKYFDNCGA